MKPIPRFAAIYNEFPRPFWTLVGATFIDRLGGFLLYPFFALYLTRRFGIGMTQVGVLFAAFSLSAFVGSALGGALTDRLGRKSMLIFSLIASSLSALLMGLVGSFQAFFLITLLVGTLSEMGGPAHQAMTADLLPEKLRTRGFGILRVAFNLSAAIGPAIGGLIAARSYLALFIIDAVISLITALIVRWALPETRPQPREGEADQGIGRSFRGYGIVLQNQLFMLFTLAGIFSGLAYMNMNTTLGVFLRDQHGIPESGYGMLLTLNAVLVVLLQFWVTRQVEERPPLQMMAVGALFYAVGFAAFGFVASYPLFMLAIVIITFGEMIVSPVSQTLIAHFAPEDMRGRYMAVAGISWGVPFAVGPYLAGRLLDSTLNPNWLWVASGFAALVAVGGYLFIQSRLAIVPSTQAEQPVER